MPKKSRFLPLALAVCLLLALFAGCGNSGNSGGDDGSANTSAASSNVPSNDSGGQTSDAQDDPLKKFEAIVDEDGDGIPDTRTAYNLPLTDDEVVFTYMKGYNTAVTAVKEGMEYLDVMIEMVNRTNVTIEWMNLIPSNMQEQFSIFLSAGTLTDFVSGGINYYRGGGAAAIEDGYFVNVADYLEYMPNYNYLLNSNEDLMRIAVNDNGAISSFYQIYETLPDNDGIILRGDWLEELNMDIPVTYDELHDVLYAMKSELGVTNPLLLLKFGDSAYAAFSQGYGVNGYFVSVPALKLPIYVVDGTVHFTMMEDGYVEYLTMMNQWWQAGLIQPDMAGFEKQSDYLDLIYNEKIGVMNTSAANITSYADNTGNKDAYYVGMPYPTKDGGKTHLSAVGEPIQTQYEYTVELTTNCENIELAVQWIDYMYSEEGSFLFNWGIEGQAFEYDENGNPAFTELITNNPDGLPMQNAVFCYAMTYAPFVEDSHRYWTAYTEEQIDLVTMWAETRDNEYSFPVTCVPSVEDQIEFAGIYADLQTLIEESVLKFITGDTALSEYDAFRQKLIDGGIERCIEIYQDAYDRYMSKV